MTNHSIFTKKRIWFNQKSKQSIPKSFKNSDKLCPHDELITEAERIFQEIQKNTICYCVTHRALINIIKEKEKLGEISNIKIYETFELDVNKMIRPLITKKCKNCEKLGCSYRKAMKTKEDKRMTMFYAIKFKKE